jgi:3-oxoacyl-[acyl-carrier-protein] synthase III
MYFGAINYSLGKSRHLSELENLRNDETSVEYLRSLGLEFYSEMKEDEFIEKASFCLEKSLVEIGDRNLIEAVFYGTSSYEHLKHKEWSGFLSCELKIGGAIPYNVSMAGCANFIHAINVASTFLQASVYNTVAVVAGDVLGDKKFSRLLPGRTTIGSDGVASFILSKDRFLPGMQFSIQNIQMHYEPRLYNKNYKDHTLEYIELFSSGYTSVFDKIYNHCNVNGSDIDLYVPGNYNTSVLRGLADTGQIEYEKIYSKGLSAYAHCFAADQVISLADIAKDPAIQSSSRILITGAGDYIWGGIFGKKL